MEKVDFGNKIIFFPYPGTYKNKKEKYTLKECLSYAKNYISKNKKSLPPVAIIECVQAVSGIIIPPKIFIKEIFKLFKENNIYIIVDEIWNGMGRTGKFFSFQRFNIKPDFVCLGKGVKLAQEVIPYGNVTVVQATPEKNLRGTDPPGRVQNLSAWDHPQDKGEAIDVSWAATDVDDFGYYVIWASSQPVDNLAATWARCKDDVSACGAVKMDIQYPINSEQGLIGLTLTKALYDGDSVENSDPDTIRANVPLSVTVTIHDLYGSAFLTYM